MKHTTPSPTALIMSRLTYTLLTLTVLATLTHLLPLASCQTLTAPPTNPDGSNIRQKAFAQIQYVSITKIDGVEQSFKSDFYMLTTWAAPKHSVNVTLTDDMNALSALYWQPQLDFINAIGGITALVDAPLSFIEEPSFDVNATWPGFVLPDDWIWCTNDNRYVGEFLTPVEMKAFPYDTQTALVQIESFWDTTQVEIVFAQPEHIQLDYLFPPTMPEILGWHPVDSTQFNQDILYSYNGRVYNRLTLAIYLSRIPDFYLNKLVAGCVMLVAMCVSLFLLTADEADRLMGSFAVFAGLIAYLFVASVYTPTLPYSTALDQFLMLCFVSIIAQSATHAAMFYYRERERIREEEAANEEKRIATEMAQIESSDDEDGVTLIKKDHQPHRIGIGASEPATPKNYQQLQLLNFPTQQQQQQQQTNHEKMFKSGGSKRSTLKGQVMLPPVVAAPVPVESSAVIVPVTDSPVVVDTESQQQQQQQQQDQDQPASSLNVPADSSEQPLVPTSLPSDGTASQKSTKSGKVADSSSSSSSSPPTPTFEPQNATAAAATTPPLMIGSTTGSPVIVGRSVDTGSDDDEGKPAAPTGLHSRLHRHNSSHQHHHPQPQKQSPTHHTHNLHHLPLPTDSALNTSRARKRERKRQAKANVANVSANANAHTTQGEAVPIYLMNPLAQWLRNMKLTKVRKLDLFFVCFFIASFVIGTACIFGIPKGKQRKAA